MNVTQKFESILVRMGMFDTQAEQVMELAKPELDKTIKYYDITWESDSTGYPDVIYRILMIEIKPIALEWIEDNTPHAWYKVMFE